ncbi:MAG: glycerophosphodiester phosphodiesterase family protein [Bacteroidota bacterium]
MQPLTLISLIAASLLIACSTPSAQQSTLPLREDIDLQGHRGARGLFPENSLPGFKAALELGVNTLELDLVISQDSQVVVSHEPWLSEEICLDSTGQQLTENHRLTYNLYSMDYASIRSYDCGTKPHSRFPQQKKMATYKPLLREVVDSATSWSQRLERPLPYYNVEIKRRPVGDSIFHPPVETFVYLVLQAIQESGIQDRCIVQSFDPQSLQLVHQLAPGLPTALLVENTDGPQANLSQLGFVPDIYSPDYQLVDLDLTQFCKAKKMKLIPWTVNDTADMSRLLRLGVDGLITDYPDRANQIFP